MFWSFHAVLFFSFFFFYFKTKVEKKNKNRLLAFAIVLKYSIYTHIRVKMLKSHFSFEISFTLSLLNGTDQWTWYYAMCILTNEIKWNAIHRARLLLWARYILLHLERATSRFHIHFQLYVYALCSFHSCQKRLMPNMGRT